MIDFSQIPSPCYVMDEDLLAGNLEMIRETGRRAGVDVIPALKGFAMWGVFPRIRPYVKGIAASSPNEARLGYEEMGVRAHAYAPAYTDGDFDGILRYSSHITFNSLTQYHRFRERALRRRPAVSMGLRVNPELSQVETGLYNPCSPGSRLGLTDAQIGDTLPAGIEGLHVHALCESPAEATLRLIEATEARFGHLFPNLQWINFGGGHLITRKGYDADLLVNALLAFRARYPHLRVILEPGAAFVWETGVLRATVEDVVIRNGIRTAILDVSFTAHMPDCLEMPYKPRIRGASDCRPGQQAWRMGGNSCLAGDFTGDWSFRKEPYAGMTVIFEDMIHYTMVKTTFFNGVAHPSIGVYSREKGFVLLKSFGYVDYKNRLS
ncbi:MAG: carboxynorspermidine decarboxylase [Bacteroidales bacterium]|jgi:carboxynorspermidine decarboxylase|nr:carboxynorspermidine decarboxylase [Bacteroidales bacterium]